MKTVGVTGGSGFIGSYVIEELVRRGYEPIAFDHVDHKADHRVYLGDIRDEVAVTEFAAHVDGLIHLAGVLGTQETIQNPVPAVMTNVLGGLNVLEAATQYDLPVVYIGVGNHWMLNPYSVTKTTVEKFCEMYRKERGTKVSIVRALNAYGPRQVPASPYGPSRVRKMMPSFVCRALDGKPIEIYGDGTQVMDFIWAGDVARVLITALENPHHGVTTPFEAGSGRRTTVNEVAALVVEAIGEGHIEIIHQPMRPGEEPHSVVMGDPSTLKPIGLDGSDFVSLEEGIARTVGYYSEYLKVRVAAVA